MASPTRVRSVRSSVSSRLSSASRRREVLRSSVLNTVEILENRQMLTVNPIGINFADGTGGTGIGTNSYNLAPGASVGVVPISNWNNEHSTATGNGASGSAAALTDSTGAATGVGVQWQANGTWDALTQESMTDQLPAPDQTLMAGYLDNFGGTAVAGPSALTSGSLGSGNGILLTGVPDGLYDLYVYSMQAATP